MGTARSPTGRRLTDGARALIDDCPTSPRCQALAHDEGGHIDDGALIDDCGASPRRTTARAHRQWTVPSPLEHGACTLTEDAETLTDIAGTSPTLSGTPARHVNSPMSRACSPTTEQPRGNRQGLVHGALRSDDGLSHTLTNTPGPLAPRACTPTSRARSSTTGQTHRWRWVFAHDFAVRLPTTAHTSDISPCTRPATAVSEAHERGADLPTRPSPRACLARERSARFTEPTPPRAQCVHPTVRMPGTRARRHTLIDLADATDSTPRTPKP